MPKLILLAFILVLQLVYCRDESKPLFLTPLIEAGNITEAQKAAKVKPFLKEVVSYSGYLTANKASKSHMFFWFFPKTANWTSAPLVLWLQGGRGVSSLYALFSESGPYVFKKGKLRRREYSWANHFNVLYIDNPVGTGFSFTESDKGYVENQTQVGENLHETLKQFLLLFPQLQKNHIILSGESYAGKYLSALASTILKKSKETKLEITVFGVFMGSPMISPEHMLGRYNEYFYSHSLLDLNGKDTMQKREEKIATFIKAKKWLEAADLFGMTFSGGITKESTLFYQLTGIRNYYHLQKDSIIGIKFKDFLNLENTKEALHVGSTDFEKTNWLVSRKLKPDMMKSMKPVLEEVLENYRVLIFSGQMDIISPYYANENLFRKLSWSGSFDYYNAQRQQLNSNKHLVGYYKKARNFVEVLVRNSGHLVPFDKPQWALGLLKKFADGEFDKSTTDSVDISF